MEINANLTLTAEMEALEALRVEDRDVAVVAARSGHSELQDGQGCSWWMPGAPTLLLHDL